MDAIIERVPSPKSASDNLRALIFDNKGVGISMNLYDNATEIVNSMSYHLSNASKNKIVKLVLPSFSLTF